MPRWLGISLQHPEPKSCNIRWDMKLLQESLLTAQELQQPGVFSPRKRVSTINFKGVCSITQTQTESRNRIEAEPIQDMGSAIFLILSSNCHLNQLNSVDVCHSLSPEV